MPSAFDGKWNLAAVEGAIAFYDAINSTEEHKAMLRKLAEAVKQDPTCYVEELKVDDTTFHRQCFINGEKKRDSGAALLNTEVSAKIADGRPAQIKICKESDSKLVRTEVGEGFTLTSTFEVTGDELTVTMTNGTVTTTEKYKRVG